MHLDQCLSKIDLGIDLRKSQQFSNLHEILLIDDRELLQLLIQKIHVHKPVRDEVSVGDEAVSVCVSDGVSVRDEAVSV